MKDDYAIAFLQRECVRKTLLRLGNTPELIAASLRELNIKDNCNDYYNNPLSNYLLAKVKLRTAHCIVVADWDRLGVDSFPWWYFTIHPELKPLAQFLDRFNKGDYRELIN